MSFVLVPWALADALPPADTSVTAARFDVLAMAAVGAVDTYPLSERYR